MVLLAESSPPQVADGVGVGTPLPHLQDCVYLGKKQLLLSDDGYGWCGALPHTGGTSICQCTPQQQRR